MARKGYRKNFLSPEDCPHFAEKISVKMKTSWDRFDNQEISAPELTADFLYFGIQEIFPGNWKSRRRTSSLSLHPALEFGFRALPESAHQSLEQWFQNKYPLFLFTEVPSVETVLRLQSQGQRCVSVIRDPQRLCSYILGERDPLSFTVHDLIHAEHFFREDHQKNVQIGFSRLMKALFDVIPIRNALAERSEFSTQFEYAASDMNSHGAHLCKYLKAIFQQNDLFGILLDSLQSPTLKNYLSENQISQLQKLFMELSTPDENAQTLYRFADLLYLVAQVPLGKS